MSLDNSQKNYIKKNLRHHPVAKIAADLKLSESDVLDYLKKRWSPEKYGKFLRNREASESPQRQTMADFSLSNFIRENRLILVLLAILVFVSYFNSFFNGFVSDDVAGFARNENIGKFSAIFGNAMHFSLSGFLSFIAYHIWGLHPFTFRMISIFFHLGSTILIYLILLLTTNKRISLIAASLFAVHPILIESVAWISGGLYAQYAFFFLLSFLFYLLSKNNHKLYYYSIAFYILALLSSEKAVVLFSVFILYELVSSSLKQNWKKTIPFFLLGVFLALLFVSKIGTRISSVEALSYQQSGGGGMENPLYQVPVAIVSYLGLIFWPDKLTLYHTELFFSKGMFILIYFVFIVFLGAMIYGYKKNKPVFFWLVFFVIVLLPTLTPFKISWVVAERYVYLGSLGIFVVIAMLFDKIASFNVNAKMVAYTAIVLIVVSLSARTIVRNKDWKNEDSLWFATARVAPSGQNIHNNLGDVYARNGDMPKAVEEFKKAIEINPNYADAYHNLGNTYQQMGQLDAAIENYQTALKINPNLWQSCQNLASIYFNAGDSQKALENIKKALEIDPQNQQLQDNLKIIETKVGN